MHITHVPALIAVSFLASSALANGPYDGTWSLVAGKCNGTTGFTLPLTMESGRIDSMTVKIAGNAVTSTMILTFESDGMPKTSCSISQEQAVTWGPAGQASVVPGRRTCAAISGMGQLCGMLCGGAPTPPSPTAEPWTIAVTATTLTFTHVQNQPNQFCAVGQTEELNYNRI
jgi:hypothetical protein